MHTESRLSEALTDTWNREQAEKSLLRWLELSQQNNWGDIPADLSILGKVFGASWYFTRFIFYRGLEAGELLNECDVQDVTTEKIRTILTLKLTDDIEDSINKLALVKNEWMLKILLCYLRQELDIAQAEELLTVLAESVLVVFCRHLTRQINSQQTALAILAMGRMSGYEMTFGSDLDLIFLYKDSAETDNHLLSRQIQKVLRYLGSVTPLGSLYEVDMRLRPHGTAGALVTSVPSFMDYHAKKRDIWERQMMTRCRIVYDPENFAITVMDEVNRHIYQEYNQTHLLQEIVNMRQKVQRELGQPKDKYEIKRGRGGIMDVDFLCHYFQLSYGHQEAVLRTKSTRKAISLAEERGFLSQTEAHDLIQAYDYLKKIEMVLRLWDLKSVDSFPFQHQKNSNLAVACGFAADQTEQFIEQYISVIDKVRSIFERKLASI